MDAIDILDGLLGGNLLGGKSEGGGLGARFSGT